MSGSAPIFSEREFYLSEFRRRSIAFAWPADEAPVSVEFEQLVDELVANQTRIILMSARDDVLALGSSGRPIDFDSDDFSPRLWRSLETNGVAGLRLPKDGFEAACRQAALEMRLAKVVWIQSTPPVLRRGGGGGRVSVVDLAHLGALLGDASEPDHADESLPEETSSFRAAPERRILLEAIRELIRGGVPAVNVCAPGDIAKELLTYAGAGTFFTRDRYAEVRSLGIDDFDTANDLITRGEADGFLVPRDSASRDIVLAHAVGVFIEGRYLAGIGAILPYPEDSASEIASLYALTRYVGEGVGGQIVRFAIDQAARQQLAYLFSCTTSDRVEEFFVRNGFRVVAPDEVPTRKWDRYDVDRRSRVRCLRFDP